MELDADGYKDVSYAGLEGDVKRGKALEDILSFLGAAKFTQLHLQFIEHEFGDAIVPSLRLFRRWLSFAGVQGYPAQAWYELLYGTKAVTQQEEADEAPPKFEPTEQDLRARISAIRSQLEDLVGEARTAWEEDRAPDDLWHGLEDVVNTLVELEPEEEEDVET